MAKGAPEPSKKKNIVINMGLPGWMGTYADMVTLLLTFFVLLLSFAKTEEHKSTAALGSIRNAFGGNVLVHGNVIQMGKSPDDSPTMLESQEPIRPFPIEFLTMEGLLEKREANRHSEEELKRMRQDLQTYELSELVNIEEVPEGIKVRPKDAIYFKEGSIQIDNVSVEVLEKIINLVANENWTIFVEGHASQGEVSSDESKNAFELSAARAFAVTSVLIKKGIKPAKITPVFYGDTRPDEGYESGDRTNPYALNRRVEFLIRKTDLRSRGLKPRTN